MSKTSSLSIAMCTYNGCAYLREQLESILVQTIKPSELIVCDDYSKDSTLEILYEFKEKCKFPVLIFANSENIGVNKNFEQAITHCTSEFIVLADQDDIWLPNKLEVIFNTFQDNPDCGYVFSNADLIDENGITLGCDLWQSIKYTPKRRNSYTTNNQLEVMLNHGNFIYGMTMAFRSFYKSILLPIDANSSSLTHDTWISLILSGIGANGIAVPQSLIKYRQHRNQLSGGGSKLTPSKLLRNVREDLTEVNLTFADAFILITERLKNFNQSNKHLSSSITILTEKVSHIRNRNLICNSKGQKKIILLFNEALSGRYYKYSSAFNSIVKDFFSLSKMTFRIQPDNINNTLNRPNFFIVGAVKSATTTLSIFLNQHPYIYISPIKEPHFFSKDIIVHNAPPEYIRRVTIDTDAYFKKKSLDRLHTAHIEKMLDYMKLFREVKNETVIGEASPSYLYSTVAAENIFTFNASSKILILLRQPVERAFSHYLADLKSYTDSDEGFISALESDFALARKGWGVSHLYVELGLYFEQVSRYLKYFPKEQVKIFLYDDFVNEPVAVAEEILQFLEVDKSLVNIMGISVHNNIALYPRYKIPAKYLGIFNVLKSHLSIILPNKTKELIKSFALLEESPKLRKVEFELAMQYFNEDIEKLSILIGRDLNGWQHYKE